MVSGALALLKQAFPNHTPEQLVDRLLATANNSFFTSSAETTFNNGVKHGYNTEFGHGTPDLLGALSPVSTSSYSTMSPTGSSISQSSSSGGSHSPSSSFMVMSSSFGMALNTALVNENFYFYDALNGGFKIPFSQKIFSSEDNSVDLLSILNTDIARLNRPIELQEKSYNYSFGNVLGAIGNKDTNLLSISIDAPSAPIQYFNKLNNDNAFGLASFNNPFVDSTNGGIGISSEFNYGDKKIMLGFHDSGLRSGLFGESEQEVKTLAVAMSSSSDNFANITVLAGLMIEEDTLLDSKGSGALGFHGTNPHSLFAGVNL